MKRWWAALRPRLVRIEQVCLAIVRRWWRPFLLVGVGVGTWVNLVLIPLATWKLPHLGEAALWIGACGGLSWIRSKEKKEGTVDAP